MKRKCDRCDHEATVHEVVIRNGHKVEKHLCESCAREEGVAVQHLPISDLLTKFVAAQAGAEKPPAKSGVCPGCGLTFTEFRQQGLLGCAECYGAFEQPLRTMIERAHEGATHHVGKSPRRTGGTRDREERLSALRKQLREAIAAEQYERAASLRDQMLHADRPRAERRAEG
jgi:protein arginine kinase activator